MKRYQLVPVGDQAISIEFPNEINPQVNLRLQALARIIVQSKLAGVQAVIPAYHTLMVTYDAMTTTLAPLEHQLKQLIEDQLTAPLPPRRTLFIPVCYEEPYGPDLADVADYAGISAGDVIKKHTKKSYLIYFLGFLPGFAYMASVDKQIAMPRLSKPRVKIPAGSVGIAGIQTGFYPVTSPGGWRLIGKTPLTLYRPDAPEPFYHAGDEIKFEAIDKPTFKAIKQADQLGHYQVKVVSENA